jgi:hypothetical protein
MNYIRFDNSVRMHGVTHQKTAMFIFVRYTAALTSLLHRNESQVNGNTSVARVALVQRDVPIPGFCFSRVELPVSKSRNLITQFVSCDLNDLNRYNWPPSTPPPNLNPCLMRLERTSVWSAGGRRIDCVSNPRIRLFRSVCSLQFSFVVDFLFWFLFCGGPIPSLKHTEKCLQVANWLMERCNEINFVNFI